jgi:hypothetical protein
MFAPGGRFAKDAAVSALKSTKGFPVGMSIKDVGKVFPTSIASKSEVQNVANDFADQFKQMGFDVTLDHSGSKAGASSYLRVSDPQTGRFLSKPIRISDHSKGAKELDANINILNPQEDFAKITSALNDMRAKGDTLVFKQDKYAQELIANGIKPKTAYQRAKTEVAEVQAPQEAALRLAQQRAALPVEKGGLGLPKNNTPMDRAEAMGFRTKDRMYHGTQEETITKFQPTRHDESAILGTSLARSPRIANFYAGGRSTKPAVEDAGNVIPVFVQGKKPQDFGKFVDYGLENNLFGRGRSNLDDTKNAYDYLEKKNLAGFDYKDLYGDEVQVVNPDRIRSVFAAFDPFRKTAATAALYGVAAPDLLAAEQNPMEILLQSRQK